MFLKMRVNENTRRMVFEDTKSTAGVVGDSNVDGIIFYLPENSEYFEFQNAVVYVVFFDATNTSHKQVLDQIDDYSGMPKWTFDDNVLKNDATSQVPFFLHMVVSDTSGKVLKSWTTLPSAFIVYKNRDYNNQEEEAIRETDIDRLAGLVTTLTEKAKTIGDVEKVLASITGSSPKPVDTETKMIDDGHIYLYTGNETGFVTGALYYYIDGDLTYGGVYGSYDLDTTLTEAGKAADAGAVGAAIDEVKEDLSEKADSSKLANLYLEFTPEYKTVEGYYTKSGDKMVFHNANVNVLSAVVTGKIYCKPGYVYSYTGTSGRAIPGAFYFLGESCVSAYDAGGTKTNKEFIVPDGVDAVIFQGYTPRGNTPRLTVELVSPALLSDIRGENGGETGQIWTKTPDGAAWVDNPDTRTREELTMLRKIATFDMNGFSYSLYEGGGYYNKNGKLGVLSYSANAYITDLIPCYTGQQFLYKGYVYGGNAFSGVFFLDNDGETIISEEGAGTGVKKLVTVPSGVSYVRFQSTTAAGSTPYLYVEDYSIVRDYRNIRPLDGVKMTILGDSISMPSMDYISYVDMLKNDGANVTNLAVSGTGIAVDYGTASNYYGRLSEIPSDTEFIVVSGSFNDLNRGPRLGTIDDEGTTTIAGYMNQLFSALLEAFPTVPMLIITTHPWSYYKPGTAKSDAYVDMLRQMGLKYGIPFYSLYDKTNLRPWIDACNTKFFRNGGDGVHPNTDGHRQLYALLKPVFVQMCYQTVITDVPGKDKAQLKKTLHLTR